MQKKRWSTAGALAVLLTSATFADDKNYPAPQAANTNSVAVKPQTRCPVMGGEVNTDIYADANGKRVYFCCNGCPAEFKKDPVKYIAKMEKEGVTLDKTPAAGQTNKQTTDAGAAPAKGHDHAAMQGCCNM